MAEAKKKPAAKKAAAKKKPAAKAAAKKAPAKKAAAKKAAAEPQAEVVETPKAKAPAKPAAKKPAVSGETVTVHAKARYIRVSARKARMVCNIIRGKDVTEARATLAHTTRSVAEPWSKLLESAIANAENNHELIGEDLKIVEIKADEGPTIKRFRPRAQGRATPIHKRTSHLSITLAGKDN